VEDGKYMIIETEESPLLEATTKQQTPEDAADCEDLACAIVIYKVCGLVTA
jgi:hypothetical protein